MPSPARIDTLASGLRVVTERVPGVRSVAIGAWIGVGSRFETSAQAGVSHLLEHLLFKGTPTRTAEQIAQTFDALGGEINAGTGRDHTVVYTRVIDDLLPRALPVMADMLQRPAMADLDQEREVVLEEIAMYEDDPQDMVHDLASEVVFPDQPLGRPVIGTAEVVGTIAEGAIRDYHALHYAAPNMVLAAAGNIDHDTLCAMAEEHLADLATAHVTDPVEPARPGTPRLLLREKPVEQVHLCVTGPGISRSDDRRHAQALLDTLLGGSMSSRLFQEVREKRGLAYTVGSYAVGFADTGQVGVYLGTREDNAALACQVIATELARLANEPVDPTELRRAKDHLRGRLVLSSESPSARMNRVGRAVLTGTELLSVDEVVERVEAVIADQLQDLAGHLWNPESLSVAAVGPRREVITTAVAHIAPDLAES